MISLVLLISVFSMDEISLDNDPDGKFVSTPYRANNFSMGENGVCLINEYSEIIVYDPANRSNVYLSVPYGFFAFNAIYLPVVKAYCVGIHKRDKFQTQYLLFDDDGLLLGNLWVKDRENDGLTDQIPFAQIIPADDRLFVNLWSMDHKENGGDMLQEAEIEYTADGYVLRRIGQSFDPLVMEARVLNFYHDYKNRWIVKEGPVFTVMDELQPRAWLYVDAGKSQFEKLGAQRPVNLSHRYQPIKAPKEFRTNTTDFLDWYYSFSRLTGFASFKNGFILAYEAPNKNHPYIKEPPTSSLGAEKELFDLHLELFDKNFTPINNKKFSKNGAYFIGVYQKSIFLFTGTRSNSSLRKILVLSEKDFH